MELVKGNLLIGPVLAIIGSILLLIGGIIWFATFGYAMGLIPMLAVTGVMTVILAILGLIGAFMAATGKKSGNYVTIIIGLIAVIGMFIPIFVFIPLVVSFIYVDPFLILLGGILGLIIK